MAQRGKRVTVNEVVSDLFNMAARTEQASAGFYLQASKHIADNEARLQLQKLASTELEHKVFFSNLKLEYQNQIEVPVEESTWRSLSNYAKAFQDSRVFDFDFILNHSFTGQENAAEVIQLAITFEKDSIVFYTGLANIFENKEVNQLLREIIREEFDHLSSLTNLDFF